MHERISVTLKCRPETGKTVQSETEGTDINLLMKRYRKVGVIPQHTKQPLYEDVSNVLDYMDAQQLMATAHTMFESLPAEIRFRFQNKPEEFLAFMNDEDNRAEAEELGLVAADPDPEPEPAPEVTPPASES